MRLYIAEKPSLAQAIIEGLGGKAAQADKQRGFHQHGTDVVTWCYGHMLELYDPEDYDKKYATWSLDDLPIAAVMPPKLKPKKEAQTQLKIISQLMAKADTIVQSCDPDEEGCLLGDEILTYFKNTKPVERLIVADLNLKPMQKALANLRPNAEFALMTQSALARSIGDQLFGYNLTRAFTLKAREKGYESVLSIGRVQTAVLGLINSRTLANQTHTESFYYLLTGKFDLGNGIVNAKYRPTDAVSVDEKGRIISELDAVLVKNDCTMKEAIIQDVSTAPVSKSAPLPFNLSNLQQTCAKQFGYSAEQTLNIAQKLYETFKLITYPRSDCRYLSDEHYASSNEILAAISATSKSLANNASNADTHLKHSAFNASKITAHHAIIPTEKKGENITLTTEERTVYELVAKQFVALFYPDSVRQNTRVSFACGTYPFLATQSVMTAQGWEALFRKELAESHDEDEEPASDIDLSTLQANTQCQCQDVVIDQKKTTPPKYFFESSLLAAMTRAAKFIEDPELRKALEAKDKDNSAENGSIGTEATRASILSKIAKNPLVTIVSEKGYKEKIWKTTPQGQEFCALLPKEIIAPDISAQWAQQQDLIRNGQSDVNAFITQLDQYIAGRVNDVITHGVSITVKDKIHCPHCQVGFLIKRKSKTGFFWGCNRFPVCKQYYDDNKGQPLLEKVTKTKPTVTHSTTEFCKQCGSALIRRPAKKEGVFWWGCSGFPKCTIRYFDTNGKPDHDKGAMGAPLK